MFSSISFDRSAVKIDEHSKNLRKQRNLLKENVKIEFHVQFYGFLILCKNIFLFCQRTCRSESTEHYFFIIVQMCNFTRPVFRILAQTCEQIMSCERRQSFRYATRLDCWIVYHFIEIKSNSTRSFREFL